MATITISGRERDSDGAALSGLTVTMHELMNDGTTNAASEDSDTTDSNGAWEVAGDSTNSESGMFAVKIVQASSGRTRWQFPDNKVQLETITGPDGTFPFANSSVDEDAIATGAVTVNKIGSRAVSSAKIEQITFDDSIVPASDGPMNMDVAFNSLAAKLVDITGETNWYDTPSSTMADLEAGGGGGTATELDLPDSTAGYRWDSSNASTNISKSASVFTTHGSVGVTVEAGTYLIMVSGQCINYSTTYDNDTYFTTNHSVDGTDTTTDVYARMLQPNRTIISYTSVRTFSASGTLRPAARWNGSDSSSGTRWEQCNLVAVKLS